MENNENKTNAAGAHGGRDGKKKPYFKHHHKKHGKPKEDQSAEQNSAGGKVNVRPGRYDLPPSEAQKIEVSKDTPKNDGTSKPPRRDGHRPHRHRHGEKRQGEHRDAPKMNTAEEAAAATESAKTEKATPSAFDDALSAMLEPQYTEHIETAGSVDSEVIDELNSVSESEAALVGASSEEAPKELALYEIVGIRFKPGAKIYYFDPSGIKLAKGDMVIVETARGLEFGTCDISNRTVTEREIILPLRTVVRIATADDISRHEVALERQKEAFSVCAEKISEHKLGMKLIDVEYAFDGSKILFYFTAEGRVDFRELVKDLAAVFRTRIELRQIGIRDETKLLGGIGICGRPFCCKTFLSDFVQVSIKMAKEQNLSLNSVKISGACGRLMCCLRYEYDTYQEEIRKSPKVDQIVRTPDGDGTVIEVQPLAGLVRVRFGTKAEMIPPKVYHRDDVKVIGGKGVKPSDTLE